MKEMFDIPPNITSHRSEDYYVSYLEKSADYGCETTALVLGQMQLFWVLKGDHREGLEGKALQDAMQYVSTHVDLLHDMSDPVPPIWRALNGKH